MKDIIRIKHLHKSHGAGEAFSLHMEEVVVQKGELVALVGPSGCGKSTALDVLSTALEPEFTAQSEFILNFKDQPLDILSLWQKNNQSALAALRQKHIGYILQTGGLLPFLTGYDNIALSCSTLEHNKNITNLAAMLDITHLLSKKPAQMSVGERQRFAIARALIHDPKLILADEPVASLDPYNANMVLELFTRIAQEKGITVVMVSHFPESAKAAGFRLLPTTVSRQDTHIHAFMGARIEREPEPVKLINGIAPVGSLGKGSGTC